MPGSSSETGWGDLVTTTKTSECTVTYVVNRDVYLKAAHSEMALTTVGILMALVISMRALVTLFTNRL